MNYEDQRKILTYIRNEFKFSTDRYYYFDMQKIDLGKAIFEYEVFTCEKKFDTRIEEVQSMELLHIIAMPDAKNDFVLIVNGDRFCYYENRSTGEIEFDNCADLIFDPAQIKIEILQLIRDLNSGIDS